MALCTRIQDGYGTSEFESECPVLDGPAVDVDRLLGVAALDHDGLVVHLVLDRPLAALRSARSRRQSRKDLAAAATRELQHAGAPPVHVAAAAGGAAD